MSENLPEVVSDVLLPHPPKIMGVAVSGGSDSMALLQVLHEFCLIHEIDLHAVTVDHRLREEAAQEAEHVARHCAKIGVSHDTLVWDDWTGTGNVQNAAREARYSKMAAWAAQHGIDTIAVGHTADDQAETVLMRLARRSGVDGLAGMQHRTLRHGINWVRPLLRSRRADLRRFLNSRNITWVDDPSNKDSRYDRIKVRKMLELLAPLGLDTDALGEVAEHMAQARKALDWHTFLAAKQIVNIRQGAVTLDEKALRLQPDEVQRRLLIKALNWISGSTYAPRRSSIASARAALCKGQAATLDGCHIRRIATRLWIFREHNALRGCESATDTVWDNRWRLAPSGPARHKAELRIRALGQSGLDQCPDWRDTGIPHVVLQSTPGVWKGDILIAAPVAGYPQNWHADFGEGPDTFFAALLSHCTCPYRHYLSQQEAQSGCAIRSFALKGAKVFRRIPLGNVRNLAFWAVLMVLVFALFNMFSGSSGSLQNNEVTYSEFVGAVQGGEVRNVTLDGEQVRFRKADGADYVTIRPDDAEITNLLIENDVPMQARPQQQSGFQTFLMSLLPIALLIGVWIYFMNRMQGGGKGGAMGFGKSKAKMLTEKSGRVTFDDVAGIDEAKEELEEIVEFLRNPQKFSRLGGKIPKGALLEGPPGTGKTLLARAIAGEAGVPFFTISGSDFVEMFVGVGASRVRDMFEQAKKNAPCIVFIDEIDAVGRSRGAGYGGGNDEREQTLNQLLVEMDGFEANEGVIIIAATNRKDVLDPALLRPGRFDRQVTVGNPDIKGREKILAVHARKTPLGPDVDLRIIARGSPGFSGADLANLVNEAALGAARLGRRFVTMVDFEAAKDKIMMGAERRSMVMTAAQKEMTAYHEAGHALVGMTLPKCDPVYKATIIPRGGALGMVMSLPEMDRLNMFKDECHQRLAMTMAGKAAEIHKYGAEAVSNGPAGDIQQASALARAMVLQWGMSDKVGNIDYSEAVQGYSGSTPGFSVSATTKELVEKEVQKFIQDGYDWALKIIQEKDEEFERLAQGLLEYETLTGNEIKRVMDGLPPVPEKGDDDGDQGDAPSLTAIPKAKGKAKKTPPADGGMEPEPSV